MHQCCSATVERIGISGKKRFRRTVWPVHASGIAAPSPRLLRRRSVVVSAPALVHSLYCPGKLLPLL